MNEVLILMSTYNGDSFLNEQIESLINQIGVTTNILVRDDGSTDNTTNILNNWKQKGVLDWYSGDNIGPAKSFMNLLKNAKKAEYYAFCDQDDVWDEDKLKVAVDSLEKTDKNKPALYFSNTRLVDQNLNTINISKRNPKLTLGSSLLINPATGCTQVFNYKLFKILNNCKIDPPHMHDNWVYKICMAIDGNIVFDETPHINYRQHDNNVIGGKSNIFKKYMRRLTNVIIKRENIRELAAQQLIECYSETIPKKNLELIRKVAYYRKNIINKLQLLLDKEIKTNSFEHNLSFILAVLFNSL